MPGPPNYRRFGNVDFDSLGNVVTPAATDQFVCRQLNAAGVFGDNIIQTRAQIRAAAPGEQLLIDDGTALLPGLAFVDDPDTGILRAGANHIEISLGGVARWHFENSDFGSEQASGARLLDEAATATNPVFSFAGDPNTGIGRTAADQISLIAGGVQVANLTEAAGVVQMILPLQNLAATPSLAFGDGDTGWFEVADDDFQVSIGGTPQWRYAGSVYRSATDSGPRFNVGATALIPSINPIGTDTNTGLGSGGADQLSLIAGGLDCINISEIAAARAVGFYVTAPIILQTGVAVSSAGIHAALVNLGLITA